MADQHIEYYAVNPSKVFIYQDEAGNVLQKKIITVEQEGYHVEWEVKYPRQVVYRLQDICEKRKNSVYVTETENLADQFSELGLVATTVPSLRLENFNKLPDQLKGRILVIIKLSDIENSDLIKVLVKPIGTKAREIRLIDCMKPENKQLAEAIGSGVDFIDLLESAKFVKIPIERVKEDNKLTGAEYLLDLFLTTEPLLFHDGDNVSYAQIQIGGETRNVLVESEEFSKYLRQISFLNSRYAPSKHILQTCVDQIAAMAALEGPRYDLHIRYANSENSVWIDLNGTDAVEVTPGSWNLTKPAHPLFKTFKHQHPLPEPAQNGNPWDIFNFINIPAPGDQLLLMSYLISLMIEDVVSPVLVLHGPEGSGKTTAMHIIKQLIDPDVSGVHNQSPKSVRDFNIQCAHHHLLFLDNLSKITNEVSNAICVATYGGAASERKLYHNNEIVYMTFKSRIGLNGLNAVAENPDLLDRSILFELKRLAPEKNLGLIDFEKEFEDAKPKIFGGLLNLLSRVLELRNEIEIERLPRLGDFAKVGAAVAEIIGFKKEEFLNEYERIIRFQRAFVMDVNSLAESVLILLEERGDVTTTPTALYTNLRKIAEDKRLSTYRGDFPQASNRLWPELVKIRRILDEYGIRIDRGGGTERWISIQKQGPEEAGVIRRAS